MNEHETAMSRHEATRRALENAITAIQALSDSADEHYSQADAQMLRHAYRRLLDDLGGRSVLEPDTHRT